jgi:hypothetical protein
LQNVFLFYAASVGLSTATGRRKGRAVSLELIPLGTIRITIARHTTIPGVPVGQRVVGEAGECVWEGDRVRARQCGSTSSDWLTVHADGSASVDARLLFVTDDEAHIGMTYRGKAAAAPSTGAAVYTAPTFETDDPRYTWLNHIQAVGKGLRVGQLLTYELFELR